MLVRFAGGIYAHGLLRSGPRIGIRAAWRLTHAQSHDNPREGGGQTQGASAKPV